MELDLTQLQSNIKQCLHLDAQLNTTTDIWNLLTDDKLDKSVSYYLYVLYPKSDQVISPIDDKLFQIQEIILGSIQRNINIKQFITQTLGTKYQIYGGIDRLFYDIYPFEATKSAVQPVTWSNIWRLNKSYDKIHLTHMIDSQNLCSFIDPIESDRQIELIEFVKLFDPIFEQNKKSYEDWISSNRSNSAS